MLDAYELMERNTNKCIHMDCKGWLIRNECWKRNIPPQIDEDADIYFGQDEETTITKE